MPEPRRTFAPVTLVGLAAAVLTAVASAQTWARPSDTDGSIALQPLAEQGAQLPLASALSLVALAAWGVLLVTRGRVRRLAAALGLAAAAGTLATVAYGLVALPDAVRAEWADLGVQPGVEFTGWYVAAWPGAVIAVAALAAAVRWAPAWPEMGSRYDAPGAVEPDSARTGEEDRSNLDMWKALDDGRDPTE